MLRLSITSVVFLLSIVVHAEVVPADQHRQLSNEVKVLKQRVNAVLTQLKSELKGRSVESKTDSAKLRQLVGKLKLSIAEIAEDENQMLTRVNEYAKLDTKIARSESLKRDLLRQGLFRQKISQAIQMLEKKLGSENATGDLLVTGYVDLGLGRDTLKTSSGSKDTQRTRLKATAQSKINENMTVNAMAEHNAKAIFSQFRTQDISIGADWRPDSQWRVRPTYETGSYKDVSDESKNYDKTALRVILNYLATAEADFSFKFENTDWKYSNAENFSTSDRTPELNYSWADSDFRFRYKNFARTNETTKTGDFATTGPAIRYSRKVSEDYNWSVQASHEETNYSSNSAANSVMDQITYTTSEQTKKGATLTTDLSYQESNFPSDASLQFKEYSYTSSRSEYDIKTGFLMTQSQYYYRSFSDESTSDTLTINNLTTKGGTLLGYKTTGSNQNIFNFTLADEKPRSGEQSWEIIWRREIAIKSSSGWRTRVGPLLGHRLYMDIGDLDSAEEAAELTDEEVNAGEILLENPLNYYRYGGRLVSSVRKPPVFVEKGHTRLTLQLSLDRKVFYQSDPKTSTDSIFASLRFNTPIPHDLTLNGELSYSKSLVKTEGGSEVPKDITTIFVSVRIPYEENIPQ